MLLFSQRVSNKSVLVDKIIKPVLNSDAAGLFVFLIRHGDQFQQ
jgi:hypothetical protein